MGFAKVGQPEKVLAVVCPCGEEIPKNFEPDKRCKCGRKLSNALQEARKKRERETVGGF